MARARALALVVAAKEQNDAVAEGVAEDALMASSLPPLPDGTPPAALYDDGLAGLGRSGAKWTEMGETE